MSAADAGSTECVYANISSVTSSDAQVDYHQANVGVATEQVCKQDAPQSAKASRRESILYVVLILMALFMLGLAGLVSFMFVESQETKRLLQEHSTTSGSGSSDESMIDAEGENDELKSDISYLYTEIDHTRNEVRRGKQEFAELSREVEDLNLEFTSLKDSLLHAEIFNSCSDALSHFLPSGYYLLRSSNESIVRVYCNMTLSCGGVTGGWARVAQLDFSDPSTPCPTSLSKYSVNNTSACGRTESAAGCSVSTDYTTQNVNYSAICGKIIGYQEGSPDGFEHHVDDMLVSLNLSSVYLDGVSLTYSQHAHHIWSLAALGYSGGLDKCGCDTNRPSFVGLDYSCDQTKVNGSMEILWDGSGCSEHNDAWFYRQLPETTSNDIEMRVCRDEDRDNEDILVESVEIYVR